MSLERNVSSVCRAFINQGKSCKSRGSQTAKTQETSRFLSICGVFLQFDCLLKWHSNGLLRAARQVPIGHSPVKKRQRSHIRTWLKDKSAPNFDIPAVTSGFDALVRANEGANNEGGGLADSVERAKFDAHGERATVVVVVRKD